MNFYATVVAVMMGFSVSTIEKSMCTDKMNR